MSLLWTSDATGRRHGWPARRQDARRHHRHFDRYAADCKPGEAFFAIKGEALDGHDFATAAVKAGAALLVVAEGKLPALGRLRRR